ncbi:MAG: hypothetical protein JWQ87_1997 [Candidatus Sulfotelmatobacter sp.]|nr:hypothetical protein [Candidatus Sulfotelmatobacter sp.]
MSKEFLDSLLLLPKEHCRSLVNDDLYTLILELRKDERLQDYYVKLRECPFFKEVRRRAKADLFFLAKYFIGFENKKNPLIVEGTHGRVCKLFVQKDDSKELGEQDDCKERLLLYPRSAFKSMLDVFDAVQWILNFPDIRILFMTASDDLAVGFVDDTKACFMIREVEPSFMNIFFGEFCLPESKLGNDFEFTTPQRKNKRREPTVMARSIISTMSGFHFDVIKADDIVSNKNSENEDQCRKVTKQLQVNRKTLMAFGYLDMIGTRYHEADTWGEIIERNVGDIRTEKGPNWEFSHNLTTGLQILIGRAWELKPESLSKDDKELGPDDYTLLFPEYHSYEYLLKERNNWGDSVFEGQFNQNPRPKSEIIFDRPMLVKHTVPFRELPVNGPTVITWDFAFSRKRARDFTTAAVGKFNDKGQLFVVDLERGRYKPKDLAKKVVELAVRWRPEVIAIEDAGGSNMLEPAIQNEALKTGYEDVVAVCGRIDWIPVSHDKDAKRSRMGALHPWLTDDRLFFASHLPYLEVLYTEFEVCMVNHHHDDIPDVISYLPRYAPRMQRVIETKEIVTWSREQAAWNIMFEENSDPFGRVGMGWTPPEPLTPEPPEAPDIPAESSTPGLAPMLGGGIVG